VSSSLTRFGNQRKTLASSLQSRKGARQSALYAAQRFRHGAVPQTSSLDAERAALSADQAVLEATGELDRAFIALQKSIGLGWDAPE
jgi:outer membrane protein TolC